MFTFVLTIEQHHYDQDRPASMQVLSEGKGPRKTTDLRRTSSI